MKFNNKAFTLAELLAVITVLGIIILIVFPAMNDIVQKNKIKSYNRQVNGIVEGAKNWGIKYEKTLSETDDTFITLNQLKETGYLENKELINPVTDEVMNGCVVASYYYEYQQYIYNYHDMNCSDLERNGVVARIGTTTYVTLKDAINAVTTSDKTTILMLKDITLSAIEVINKDQNIVLDMGGHTINNDSDDGIFDVYGTLTFDSPKGGTIDHKAETMVAVLLHDGSVVNVNNGNYVSNTNVFHIYEGGKLNINNGDILAPDKVAIGNYGEVVMTGGTVTSNQHSGLVNYGIFKVSNGVVSSYCTSTSDCSEENMKKLVALLNYGSVDIDGGTIFSDVASAIRNESGGNVVIDGEDTTITAEKDNTIVNFGELQFKNGIVKNMSEINHTVFYNTADANLVIEDGYFEANKGLIVYNLGATTINDGDFIHETSTRNMFQNRGNKDFVINGGNFTGRLMINNGLSSNLALTGNMYINGGNFKHFGNTYAFVQMNSGKLVIKNARLESLDSPGTNMIVYNYFGDVIVEDGTEIIAKNRVGIQNVGSGNVTINGGTFSSEDYIIQNYKDGSININSGDFYLNYNNDGYDYDVVQNGSSTSSYKDYVGTVEINGGTYHLNGGGLVYNAVNGNVTVSNVVYDDINSVSSGANYIFCNGESNSYHGNIVVNNSTIKTKNANIFENYSDGNITINGGYYETTSGSIFSNSGNSKIVIGDQAQPISNSNPKFLVKGDKVVIDSNAGTVSFHNGMLVGKNLYSSGTNFEYRSNGTLTEGTEVIDGVTYNTLYYR